MRVFISYSRQELTFADALSQELAWRGIESWIDIRGLQPGRAWLDQLFAAIDHADVLLLIVSKASLASSSVAAEWQYALTHGKRVILVIFEAVPLYPSHAPSDVSSLELDRLRACQWVDFRRSFVTALNDLVSFLKHPASIPIQPPPQTDFKMPPTPRILFLVGHVLDVVGVGGMVFYVIIAIYSFLQATAYGSSVFHHLFPILTPMVYFYLYRLIRVSTSIKQRRYRIDTLALSLVVLPIGVLAAFIPTFDNVSIMVSPFLLAALEIANLILISPLLVLLGSRGMYRWSGPTGIWTPALDKEAEAIVPTLESISQLSKSGIRKLIAGLVIVVILIWYVSRFSGIDYTILSDFLFVTCMMGFPLVAIITIGGAIINQAMSYSTRRYRRPNQPLPQPQPTTFALDFARQDRDAAQAIRRALTRYHQETSIEQADIVLTLISAFKIAANPQAIPAKIVPVLVQDVPAIDPTLAQLQWVDLRRGLNPTILSYLAHTLHDRVLLSSILGHFPRRTQSTRPFAVNTIMALAWGMIYVISVPTLFYWGFAVARYQSVPTEVIRNLASIREVREIERFTAKGPEYAGTQAVEFERITEDWFLAIDRAKNPDHILSAATADADRPSISEAWCIALGDKTRRDDMLGYEPSAYLYLYRPSGSTTWRALQDTVVSKAFFDVYNSPNGYHEHLGCTLRSTRYPAMGQQIGLNLLSSVLIVPLVWWMLKRFRARQLGFYPLGVISVVGCGVAFALTLNPMFALAGFMGVGLLIYATVNLSIRQWLPDRLWPF